MMQQLHRILDRMKAWRLPASPADLLVGGLVLAGWCGVTYGIAGLTSPLVWPISLGLFALALVGFRFLGTVAWHGITTFLPRPK